MAAKRRKKRTRGDVAKKVPVERALLEDVLRALDASEQLLDLLRGPLNGGNECFIDDLLSTFMDRVIVSARMQLARVVPRPRVPRKDEYFRFSREGS